MTFQHGLQYTVAGPILRRFQKDRYQELRAPVGLLPVRSQPLVEVGFLEAHQVSEVMVGVAQWVAQVNHFHIFLVLPVVGAQAMDPLFLIGANATVDHLLEEAGGEAEEVEVLLAMVVDEAPLASVNLILEILTVVHRPKPKILSTMPRTTRRSTSICDAVVSQINKAITLFY